jgi:flagellar basal-body rod protein FlgG
MIRALTTAATGLEAQSKNIERLSNDLANANTDGYKRARTEFQDLMYETIKEPGGALGAASQSPVGIQQGMGVKVGGQHKIFEPGAAKMTYHPFDLMVEGTGFFQVQLPNGDIAYTRTGAFKRDNQGRLLLTNGAQLVPQIQIPQNANNIVISPSGRVIAQLPQGEEQELGQIQIHRFVNEEGLAAAGAGLFRTTAASGQAVPSIPGEDGAGLIQQGALESSNVNVPNSMVEMIQTQRAYEMNTKVMKVADEMLGATSAIK